MNLSIGGQMIRKLVPAGIIHNQLILGDNRLQ